MSDSAHTQHPRETLLSLLDAATESVLVEFRRELEDAGYAEIRPTHGCVFRFVRDDGMRLTELAGLAGMTKQSVGELVDDLVDLGYVERIPDPADRRAKLICLTERFGLERLAQLRETLEEIVAREAPERVPELARHELAAVE